MFGDIIFNFEYRRMVTDFFHPTPMDEKSRKQNASLEKSRRAGSIASQYRKDQISDDDDEDSEEDSDQSYSRHQLDQEEDDDSSEDSDDYYDDEDDSDDSERESRLPAAYTKEQREVKRPMQMK